MNLSRGGLTSCDACGDTGYVDGHVLHPCTHLADPSGQKPASVSQGAIDREHCRRSAPLAGHLGSSHDDELTAEDIRYLKADHIWGDMGRGGL